MKTEWTYDEISKFSGIAISTLWRRAEMKNIEIRYADRDPLSGKRKRVFNTDEIPLLIQLPAKTEYVPYSKKAIYVNQEFRIYPSKLNYLTDNQL